MILAKVSILACGTLFTPFLKKTLARWTLFGPKTASVVTIFAYPLPKPTKIIITKNIQLDYPHFGTT